MIPQSEFLSSMRLREQLLLFLTLALSDIDFFVTSSMSLVYPVNISYHSGDFQKNTVYLSHASWKCHMRLAPHRPVQGFCSRFSRLQEEFEDQRGVLV
jgi:hypothetical protein